MGSLGPGGCGLLAVRGVPEVPILRKQLLPLAKKLALMPNAARRPVLKNYDLTADVPLKRADRPVSTFASKLRYACHSHAADGSISGTQTSSEAHVIQARTNEWQKMVYYANGLKEKELQSLASRRIFSRLPTIVERIAPMVLEFPRPPD